MGITNNFCSTISFVIGSYNRKKYLLKTINSIRSEIDNGDINCEVIVVEGGSTDGSIEWLTKQKDIVTIIQHNRGIWNGRTIKRRSWGYFMNLGFKAAQGKYICMLSDDCLVVPGSVINGYNYFEEKLSHGEKLGALAFYWRNWPEMSDYWVCKTLGDKLFVNHGMYLREALVDVGFIDEDTFLFYHADGDLCLKLWQQGWSVADSPNSYIEHASHVNKKVRSTNMNGQQRDWDAYLKKWHGIYNYNKDSVDWIMKNYKDKTRTAMKFLNISIGCAIIKYELRKYLKSIIKTVRK